MLPHGGASSAPRALEHGSGAISVGDEVNARTTRILIGVPCAFARHLCAGASPNGAKPDETPEGALDSRRLAALGSRSAGERLRGGEVE
jgi:hypothetical protein